MIFLRSTFVPSPYSFNRFFTTNTHKLQPGLILFKHGLSPKEQVNLSEAVLERGKNPSHSFWKVDAEGREILNQAPKAPHRGRIFDSLKNFPKIFSEQALNFLTAGNQIDSTIKVMHPTHLILLFYQTVLPVPKDGYIAWHQDKDPNDGNSDNAVISFSIGDSCDFLVCDEKPKISPSHPVESPENLRHRIKFESGDVLIFGGPSRHIHHSIFKIYQNTAPSHLPFSNGRLNFTFRYTPQIVGREESYSSQNFRSVYSPPKK